MGEERLAKVETAVEGLRVDVNGLRADVTELGTRVTRVEVGLQDLGREMRVLHEDTIANIKALAAMTTR
jgi:hypothetical protein